ncbi:hypothetical protein BaRGS_00036901 [Batillaria attramentaria]|uniref:ATP-dependent (S)-NAD(P)H-hydrate dehydratase n=1 Tax=Batillaria attramentaria TaxID=370345 RepID=A0ABD0JAG9_9CAEN
MEVVVEAVETETSAADVVQLHVKKETPEVVAVAGSEFLRVGQEFGSFAEFETCLKKYSNATYSTWTKHNTKTIEAQNRTQMRKKQHAWHLDEALVYYAVEVRCKHGGGVRRKGGGVRPNQGTLKLDCPARIYLRADTSKNKLVLKILEDQHNHDLDRETFLHLPEQRRLTSSDKLDLVKSMLHSGVKVQKIREYLHKEGHYVKNKDLYNLRQKMQKERDEGNPALNEVLAVENVESHRAGCESNMLLRADRDKGVLEVMRLVSEHNHPTGPDVSYRKTKRIRNNPTTRKQAAESLPSPRKDNTANMVKAIIPPLTSELHKGEAGRIGIIGGCQEYTGAPYFAAISALKVGADLSHVFCTSGAAPVIKSYSPELIVHPILDQPDAVREFEKWLPRLHTLVVGPGLGRDPAIMSTVSSMITSSKARGIPLVVDADGLFVITESPDLVMNYPTTLLTPNAVEFQRLFEKMVGERPSQVDESQNVKLLAQCFGNLTVLRKGMEDIVSDGFTVIMCSTDGSPRRCGGQGDLLSGSAAVFYNWALLKHNRKSDTESSQPLLGPGVLAGYMACRLTRECSRLAFLDQGRSMTTSDMITKIHLAFETLF